MTQIIKAFLHILSVGLFICTASAEPKPARKKPTPTSVAIPAAAPASVDVIKALVEAQKKSGGNLITMATTQLRELREKAQLAKLSPVEVKNFLELCLFVTDKEEGLYWVIAEELEVLERSLKDPALVDAAANELSGLLLDRAKKFIADSRSPRES